MTRTCGWLAAVLLVGAWIPASAQPYSARQSGDVVQLEDTARQTIVSIVPSVGNQAIEMKVNGHNVFRWTYGSVADFKAKPGMAGVPFLARGPTSSTSRRFTPTAGATRSTWSWATCEAPGRGTGS
jgi:hypothetical protein